jgi:hypothetical protein
MKGSFFQGQLAWNIKLYKYGGCGISWRVHRTVLGTVAGTSTSLRYVSFIGSQVI